MDAPLPTDLDVLPALAGGMVLALVANALLYVYFGVTLMLIARKSSTPNPWLAWIPIANLFLLCNIARRPAWWVLLLLVPVVNLVVLAMLWMAAAEVRDKPLWVGVLILLPILGLVVPAYLASGKASSPEAAAPPRVCRQCGASAEPDDEYCGDCGQALPAAVAEAVCGVCGTRGQAEDEFCGQCGTRLPAAVAVRRRTPTLRLAVGAAAAVAGIIVVTGGTSWLVSGRQLSYSPPERKPPAVPKRMAGTMTEFPVDTDADDPARPDSVVTKDFGASGAAGASADTDIPDDWLPPGLESDSLPRRATAASAATYRPGRSRAETGEDGSEERPGADAVCVTVLETPADTPGTAKDITDDVARATGGTRTGVRVDSPDGDVYTGTRIATPDVVVIVLDKQHADIVVVVYAPAAPAVDTAERLAANVGNGEGLSDYPDVRSAIWTLPAEPPAGLVLQEANCLTPYDLGLTPGGLRAAAGDVEDAEAAQILSQLDRLLPERFIYGRYRDGSDSDWEVLTCDFASPRRAWQMWQLLRWTVGIAATRRVDVSGAEGLAIASEEGLLLLFRKGPYLSVVAGPPGGTMEGLTALAAALQM